MVPTALGLVQDLSSPQGQCWDDTIRMTWIWVVKFAVFAGLLTWIRAPLIESCIQVTKSDPSLCLEGLLANCFSCVKSLMGPSFRLGVQGILDMRQGRRELREDVLKGKGLGKRQGRRRHFQQTCFSLHGLWEEKNLKNSPWLNDWPHWDYFWVELPKHVSSC